MIKRKKFFYADQLLPRFEDQFSINFFKRLKMSHAALDLRRKVGRGGNLMIILGSSGVGRDTVLENYLGLIKNAERIKRLTSRPRRKTTTDQTRMLFMGSGQFLQDFHGEKIIFAGRYHVNNQLYGVSGSELLKLQNRNKIYVFECTINALPLKKLFPGAKLILLLPPSWKILASRLQQRGDKDWRKRFKCSQAEIKKILANARKMLEAGYVDLAFVNSDSRATAVKILMSLKNQWYAKKTRKDFKNQIKNLR